MKLLVCDVLFLFGAVMVSNGQVDPQWEIHDRNRPVPPVVTPGTASTEDAPGKPPSDAVVLFEGKDLSQWVQKKDGGPVKWKVANGYFEVVPKTGDLRTKESFGDCQLHVEFAEPDPPKGEDQDRGNSGVFLMGLYEIQVLDSYNNKTYADGQASAVYGQYPPLSNASRPPGQWQTYDIAFRRPRFDAAGKLLEPALLKEATTAGPSHSGYGLGFYLLPGGAFGHGGGAPGINGELHILPQSGYVIAALTNRDPRMATDAVDYIESILPQQERLAGSTATTGLQPVVH